MKKVSRSILALASVALVSGCTSTANILNPFYESPPPLAYGGELTDRALYGTQEKAESARAALEHMATYDRAHYPQPENPVIQPAVVRLMWVPDHLNSHGDLVPDHYYYLKVKADQWAVKDAFEMERQLGPKTEAGSIPFTTELQH